MIMKKNNIYLATAVLLSLTACNKEFAPEVSGDITIDASIGAMTRVSYDGASTSFTTGDQIAVYAWMGGATEVPAKRVVDGVRNTLGTDGKWTPATQMRWKTVTDPHFFLGVYPAMDITDFTADAYTLDPAAAAYTDSDLLIATNFGTGNAGLKASNGTVPLTFDHAMAKLNVNLKFRSQWDATPEVTSVTVKAKKTATVNYLTKTVTATASEVPAPVDIPEAATVATGYKKSYSGLQVPQTGVTTVTVTIAGKEYMYESTKDIPLVGGQYTTLGLIVGKDKLELGSISVTDWEEGAILGDGDAVLFDALNTPLTFEAMVAGAVLYFDINTDVATNAVQYRTFDGTAWTDWADYPDYTFVTLANVGDKVQFRGNNERYAYNNDSSSSCSRIKVTADCLVYGNIMSLVDGEQFSTLTSLTGDFAFTHLFSTNDYLKFDSAKPLLLPAAQLSKGCYSYMFAGISGQIILPQLPATQLADYCYDSMFRDCPDFTAIPEDYLPATQLADHCYCSMFDNCSNLTTAPTLPAATLAEACYAYMFQLCPKLSSVTCLATDISAEDCLTGWLYKAGTADGCERKIYVDAGMLSNPKWHLEYSGDIGKQWTLANVEYSHLTSADIGKVLAADGKIYADAAQATAAGTTARAVIAYVGSVPNYFDQFLAIAMDDVDVTSHNWADTHTAVGTFAGTHSITISGTTYNTNAIGSTCYDQVLNNPDISSAIRDAGVVKGWRLPSVTDWRYIFDGLGRQKAGLTLTNKKDDGSIVYNSNVTPTDPLGVVSGRYYYKDGDADGASSLRAAINAACGNEDLQSGDYWSSSEYDDLDQNKAWYYRFYYGKFSWTNRTTYDCYARAVFAY